MGKMYSAEFEGVAVTAAQDFFELAPADDKPIKIHAIYLSQSSDVGDAAEEILRIKCISGHATTGSGGGTSTPAALESHGDAAGTVVEVNNTTIASAGTGIDLHSDAFNIRTGWIWIPTPEMRHRISQATGVLYVVRLMAAPTDSLTMSGTIYFEEL